ncbi:MFS transporter [Nonomuraea typhae]|uniref:MFS transporter n=1 Tax=Nonomuraea typhae TaxID=2603600 RepID=A0ABW7YVW6_9ACTN
MGSAVAVGLAGAFLARRLGRATLHLGLGLAAAGLIVLWWTIAHGRDSLTSWTLAPALLITGFGSGLVFIPIFDYVLGDATADEAGTGSGMLNAVQQFANAIGAAALGTAFFAGAGQGGFFAAGRLVTALAAALFLATLLLVGLLPEHTR